MKIFFMRIAVYLLRAVYMLFLPLKTRNKVAIISRQSNKETIDIRLIREALNDRDIETAVLTRRLKKNLMSGIGYVFHMIRQMYHISTSKVIVLDGYCILASILHKKKAQQTLQIWHALGAIKKFGWQSVGKPWGNDAKVARIMRLHRNYDYVIAPSEMTAEHFKEAFYVNDENIKLLGLPRIEYLIDDRYSKVDKLLRDYPETGGKINVLYAPTFRKGRSVDIMEIVRYFDFKRYNLIIKKHWLDKADYSWLKRPGIIVDKKYGAMDWLKMCDKIITDYSAIAFEAAILEKDLYLYFSDVGDYRKSVGLNIEFYNEAVSTYVYADGESLCRDLDEPYDKRKIRKFRDKYITVETENATEKLSSFIEQLVLSGKVRGA